MYLYAIGGFNDAARVGQWSDESENPLDLQRELQVSLSEDMPGYLVGDDYANEDYYIGMHSDSAELFVNDAVEHEAVIFSLNLNGVDAALVHTPSHRSLYSQPRAT